MLIFAHDLPRASVKKVQGFKVQGFRGSAFRVQRFRDSSQLAQLSRLIG